MQGKAERRSRAKARRAPCARGSRGRVSHCAPPSCRSGSVGLGTRYPASQGRSRRSCNHPSPMPRGSGTDPGLRPARVARRASASRQSGFGRHPEPRLKGHLPAQSCSRLRRASSRGARRPRASDRAPRPVPSSSEPPAPAPPAGGRRWLLPAPRPCRPAAAQFPRSSRGPRPADQAPPAACLIPAAALPGHPPDRPGRADSLSAPARGTAPTRRGRCSLPRWRHRHQR